MLSGRILSVFPISFYGRLKGNCKGRQRFVTSVPTCSDGVNLGRCFFTLFLTQEVGSSSFELLSSLDCCSSHWFDFWFCVTDHLPTLYDCKLDLCYLVVLFVLIQTVEELGRAVSQIFANTIDWLIEKLKDKNNWLNSMYFITKLCYKMKCLVIYISPTSCIAHCVHNWALFKAHDFT